jgi:hypothetical protein
MQNGHIRMIFEDLVARTTDSIMQHLAAFWDRSLVYEALKSDTAAEFKKNLIKSKKEKVDKRLAPVSLPRSESYQYIADEMIKSLQELVDLTIQEYDYNYLDTYLMCLIKLCKEVDIFAPSKTKAMSDEEKRKEVTKSYFSLVQTDYLDKFLREYDEERIRNPALQECPVLSTFITNIDKKSILFEVKETLKSMSYCHPSWPQSQDQFDTMISDAAINWNSEDYNMKFTETNWKTYIEYCKTEIPAMIRMIKFVDDMYQ